MTIAVDGMGGDRAPDVVVDGAVAAVRELGVSVLLTGRRSELEPLLAARGGTDRIGVVDAAATIAMDEHPASAVRQKRDSSLVVGVGLVGEGRARAFVSAGNTGAVMAAGLFELKRVRGVERPALATVIPTLRGAALLVDVGANADCRPEHLAQFALMGSVYLERVFGVSRPRVGLISIGEEASKGNLLVQQTYPRLRELPINFVGNIEGKDFPAGEVDVAVCDGFVGNVMLKLAEGLATAITGMIRQEIEASLLTKVAALGVLPAFRRVRRRLDYAEYGGAPLLGLNGICIVAHGRSDARAIKNAIRVAAQAVEQDVVRHIAEGIASSLDTAAVDRPGSTPASPGASQT
ncbi:MAG: phosphate acyltransferase PlsX [Chloroflexota bacterium]|nr:phosphate acyltransferase PlsX [Chloroflexota bacterium]